MTTLERIAAHPIDYGSLFANTERIRRAYRTNAPWPHVVIDDFLDAAFARRAAAAFPAAHPARVALVTAFGGHAFCTALDGVDVSIASILDALDEPRFVSWLERVTSIDGLEPDPQRTGAGMHQGFRGSFMRVHADHNAHLDDRGRFRRLNAIVYLNANWSPDWGGALELWDREARSRRKAIDPVFNRCVIFPGDDTAYHGYGRLKYPVREPRRSLASYYYTASPGPGQRCEPHYSTYPHVERARGLQALRYRSERKIVSLVEALFKVPK